MEISVGEHGDAFYDQLNAMGNQFDLTTTRSSECGREASSKHLCLCISATFSALLSTALCSNRGHVTGPVGLLMSCSRFGSSFLS